MKQAVFLAQLIVAAIAYSEPLIQGETISDGTKGFSIVSPPGWERVLDVPGVTLFIQVAEGDARGFKRSIQIRYGYEQKQIDKFELDSYGPILIASRKEAFGIAADYRLNHKELITLRDGRPALLYYANFEHNGVPLMEMHVLAAAESGHFVLTYTDLEENFQNRADGSPFKLAFDSVTSFHTSGVPQSDFGVLPWILAGFAGIGLLVALIRFRQGWRNSEGNTDFISTNDLSLTLDKKRIRKSPHSRTSQAVSAVSSISNDNDSSEFEGEDQDYYQDDDDQEDEEYGKLVSLTEAITKSEPLTQAERDDDPDGEALDDSSSVRYAAGDSSD